MSTEIAKEVQPSPLLSTISSLISDAHHISGLSRMVGILIDNATNVIKKYEERLPFEDGFFYGEIVFNYSFHSWKDPRCYGEGEIKVYREIPDDLKDAYRNEDKVFEMKYGLSDKVAFSQVIPAQPTAKASMIYPVSGELVGVNIAVKLYENSVTFHEGGNKILTGADKIAEHLERRLKHGLISCTVSQGSTKL